MFESVENVAGASLASVIGGWNLSIETADGLFNAVFGSLEDATNPYL